MSEHHQVKIICLGVVFVLIAHGFGLTPVRAALNFEHHTTDLLRYREHSFEDFHKRYRLLFTQLIPDKSFVDLNHLIHVLGSFFMVVVFHPYFLILSNSFSTTEAIQRFKCAKDNSCYQDKLASSPLKSDLAGLRC